MKTRTNGKIQIIIGIIMIVFSVIWGIYAFYQNVAYFQEAAARAAMFWGQEVNTTGLDMPGHVVTSIDAFALSFSGFMFIFPVVMLFMALLGVKFILDGFAMLEQ